MISERVILSYKKYFDIVVIRPATVCGYSPRMRFDLTVNALTMSALNNKIINVNGGGQIRPNVNIQDLIDVYLFFLNKKIKYSIYNVGFENLSVLNIAKKVQNKIKSKIVVHKKNFDPRSYRLDSTRLLNEGFKPKKNIDYAVEELITFFDKKKLKNNPRFYSINWLKTKILKMQVKFNKKILLIDKKFIKKVFNKKFKKYRICLHENEKSNTQENIVFTRGFNLF